LNILSNLEAANGNLKAPQFRIHLVERDEYLNVEDDHPLLTESVDQCLSLTSSLSNFKHLKIYVEWEAKHADMVALKLIREILTEHSSVHEVNVNLPESSSTTTLSDCLDLFMKEETVGMDKQWECPNCHALQIGITKRGTLWTLPEILVIHLKRFRQVGLI
jgi:Zn finger protein HypA/HybF involved in hydrogenase expression